MSQKLTDEELEDKLASANEMTLTGNQAFHLFLKLKRMHELEEENQKLKKICRKVASLRDEIYDVAGRSDW